MRSFLLASRGALLALLPFTLQAQAPRPRPAAPIAPDLHYVANRGQLPQQVLFSAEAHGAGLFVERGGIVFVKREAHDHHHARGERHPVQAHAWRWRFVGADTLAPLVEQEQQAFRLNYFRGNDPERWATGVPAFAEVHRTALWPGVDLRLHGQGGHFKYDLQVRDAAALDQVAFAFDGADGLRLGPDGGLLVRTSVGDVVEQAPVAWYADAAGGPVACGFRLDGNTVRFALRPGTDRHRPIVVDPVLLAATLTGTSSSSENYGHCATFDAEGNIYTGARSFGIGYPTTLGAFQENYAGGYTDIAISKFSPDGSGLVYATYLGGDFDDAPHSLIVNADNELFMMGSSTSTDYPTTAGAHSTTNAGPGDWGEEDIVVTHLNVNGSALVGSTYVGGQGSDGSNFMATNYGDEYRGEIILDGAGNCVVVGCSASSGFPTTPGVLGPALQGAQDGVFFSMDPALSNLLFSTYLGGGDDDVAYGVKPDGSGGYYVCGSSTGDGPPTTPGAAEPVPLGVNDAFLVHVAPGATSVLQGTYFGTPQDDAAYFVDTDEDGDVFIFGESTGDIPTFPAATFGVAGDLFVAKFSPDLSTTLLTSEVGTGSTFDNLSPIAFLVDLCGNIYVSAHAGPGGMVSGMPLTADAFQNVGGFYLAAFDEDMVNLLFGTYFGGADDHVDGGTSRFDEAGIVYQAVCTNYGFNTTPGAYSDTYPGGYDLGVFKIGFNLGTVSAAAFTPVSEGCAPVTVAFENTSTGENWAWDFGDGSPEVLVFEPTHTFTDPGEYEVRLIASDPDACNLADTTYLTITVGSSTPVDAAFTVTPSPDCDLTQVTTQNLSTGATVFVWDMGDGTELTDEEVTHTYDGPGTYTVQLIASDPTGCSVADSLSIEVEVLGGLNVTADIDLETDPGCEELVISAEAVDPSADATYTWTVSDGTEVIGTTLDHTVSGAGTYTITLIANDPATCNVADTVTTTVEVLPVEPIDAAFGLVEDGSCGSVTITATDESTGDGSLYLWEMSDGATYNTADIEHEFSGAGSYTVTLTVSDPAGCATASTTSATVTVPEPPPVEAVLAAEQSGDCSQLLVSLTEASVGDGLTFALDLGDGTAVLDEVPPTYVYPDAGSYTITLTVTDALCGTADQTTVDVTMTAALTVDIVGDTLLCPGGELELQGIASEGALLWSTGATTPTLTVTAPGTYTVVATTPNCTGSAAVDVVFAPTPPTGPRVESCPERPVVLRIPVEEAISYQWEEGSTGQELVVQAVSGVFHYSGIDRYGCAFADSAVVETLDPEAYVYIPNAFTPDGDGINDTFGASALGHRFIELQVFDRWGERVHAAENMAAEWDGSYNGKQAKNDTYVFRLRYTGVCDEGVEVVRFGHVTVVR